MINDPAKAANAVRFHACYIYGTGMRMREIWWTEIDTYTNNVIVIV